MSLAFVSSPLLAEPPTTTNDKPPSADAVPISKKFTTAEQQRLDEANRLNQQVLELYKQRKYREALPLAKQDLAIRREILGDLNAVTASAFRNVGWLLREMGE